jgi:hypothetical protein
MNQAINLASSPGLFGLPFERNGRLHLCDAKSIIRVRWRDALMSNSILHHGGSWWMSRLALLGLVYVADDLCIHRQYRVDP